MIRFVSKMSWGGGLPVKFNKTSFTYENNKYMSYQEVLKIIIDLNVTTQTSPLTSDSDSD